MSVVYVYNFDLSVLGSPCDNYLGYCDIFSKCRKVDAEGPLSKLKNFIFNKETFNSIYTWMKEKWWACALIGLGLILFMAGEFATLIGQ